jgi:hypothetical protein
MKKIETLITPFSRLNAAAVKTLEGSTQPGEATTKSLFLKSTTPAGARWTERQHKWLGGLNRLKLVLQSPAYSKTMGGFFMRRICYRPSYREIGRPSLWYFNTLFYSLNFFRTTLASFGHHVTTGRLSYLSIKLDHNKTT